MDALPLLFSNASDPGKVRSANEDSFAYLRSGERHLFVVADGMGGEAGGRIASTTAVAQVRAVFEGAAAAESPKLLADCVAAAGEACRVLQSEDPELAQMGTTLVLLLIEKEQAFWAHVGDSRLYKISEGRAVQLTKDHTRVQKMLEDGLLTPEQAAEHPQRNVLSRAVGREHDCVPDVTPAPCALLEGDAFLLCSDGLTDVVQDDEIAGIVSRADPARACRELIRLALSRGAPDNVTVQVVYKGRPRSAWQRLKTVVPLGATPRARRARRSVRPWVVLGAAALILATLSFLILAGGAFRWWPTRPAEPSAKTPASRPSRPASPATKPDTETPSPAPESQPAGPDASEPTPATVEPEPAQPAPESAKSELAKRGSRDSTAAHPTPKPPPGGHRGH